MIIKLFLILVLSIILGFSIINLLWQSNKKDLNEFFLKLFLATGIGIGLTSSLFFLFLIIFNEPNAGFILVELGLIVILSIITFLNKKRCILPLKQKEKTGIYLKPLLISFLISVILVLLFFIFVSIDNPYGNWDGWGIWGMRSRFIFRSGDNWINTFSNHIDWTHPDYPLLVTGFIAGCWHFLGQDTQIVPISTSIIFSFATIGILLSSLSLLRSNTQGLIAAFILISTVLFISEVPTQCADIPISFFFLSTIVLFFLFDKSKSYNHIFLILAGLTSSLAAWTKNEGILFVLFILIARILTVLPTKGWKELFSQLFWYILGLIPISLILIYFKLNIAPANDLFYNRNLTEIFTKLTDISRYTQIFIILKSKTLEFSQGMINPLLILIYFAILGIKIKNNDRLNIIFSALVLLFMSIGYLLIYIISPYDISWHAKSSLHRLIVQLWPTILFISFMVIKTPEEYLTNNSK